MVAAAERLRMRINFLAEWDGSLAMRCAGGMASLTAPVEQQRFAPASGLVPERILHGFMG